MTLLRRILSQVRRTEADSQVFQALDEVAPLDVVQIPRKIAEHTLDLIGSCLVCVDGVSRHHDVREAMKKALEANRG